MGSRPLGSMGTEGAPKENGGGGGAPPMPDVDKYVIQTIIRERERAKE